MDSFERRLTGVNPNVLLGDVRTRQELLEEITQLEKKIIELETRATEAESSLLSALKVEDWYNDKKNYISAQNRVLSESFMKLITIYQTDVKYPPEESLRLIETAKENYVKLKAGEPFNEVSLLEKYYNKKEALLWPEWPMYGQLEGNK